MNIASGGCLVVRHWPIAQEVVDSNPTNGKNQFLSCARSPVLLSPFGKMGTGWDLKYDLCPSLIGCHQ